MIYYYFCASDPLAIKLNGIYLGTINDTIKFCNIENDNTFVELCPLVDGSPQINFVIDQNFHLSPPNNVILTDLKGGYLVKLKKCFKKCNFTVLSQKKFDDAVVTLFAMDGLNLSIENSTGVFNFPIDFLVNTTNIEKLSAFDNSLIKIELIGDKKVIIIFNKNTNKIIFNKEYDELQIDNKHIVLTESFIDIKKHRLTTTWAYKDGGFQLTDRKVTCKKQISIFELNNKIIPYAFLEDLCLGQDISEYLADNIRLNADKFNGFFGEFVGVMPPPFFRAFNEIGIVYRISDNKYTIEYFTFEIVDKKIYNVKKVDK